MATEIAMLFECGRDSDRAALCFSRAARNAATVFAYPEAAILCERGLSNLLALPESRERDTRELEFSLLLGMAQMATCGYAAPEVEMTHRRCRELCVRLGERRRLVRNMVRDAMAGLNDKERYIIENRLMTNDPKTLQEIGKHFRISRERARQIEGNVIRKMRDYLLECGLEPVAA